MKIKKRSELIKEEVSDINARSINFFPVITERDGAPNFSLRLFEIEPDGHTPYHNHDWEHEVYIIDGCGFINGENKKLRIEKSDFIFVEPGETHQFIAGESGLKMICIVPNKGQPFIKCNT
ncbi:MAG: cupin domain-containing protein [Actinobacteria bacterium]|nr:cupin domain-containing protein [Actinomycetota bacterium]